MQIPNLITLLAASSILTATAQNITLPAPLVTIQNGTIRGSTDGTVESFKGIPYAQAPVGALRLRPPRTLNASFGTISSNPLPNACPQFVASSLNVSGLPAAAQQVVDSFLASANSPGPSGEDCLTINVQRPAGTAPGAKLPVVFWTYGGAFVFGSTQMYDGSMFLRKSAALGLPVVYVAANYRLGGFGFLPGRAVQKDGATNLGLRDQRLALQWVAENIAAFGGDPDKVTLWGESAGAASTFDQTMINGGDNTYRGKALFRGAIMDSGSTQPVNSVTSAKSENTFAAVVAATNCTGAADVMGCLRSVPYTQYLAAVNSVPGVFSYRGLDEAYLPKPDPACRFFTESPEVAVRAGRIARVPTIIGDQEDEGTLFSLTQSNISTTAQLAAYVRSVLGPSTPQQVAGFVDTYPDDAAAGSPFGTGAANEIYPQYKRLAAMQGDYLFTLQRRIYLGDITAAAARSQPAWSYLASYGYGTPVLGTFHASDVLALYFGLGPPGVVDAILTYYVSFVNFLDPNAVSGASVANLSAYHKPWPLWNARDRQLLHFNANATGYIRDDFREASYAYLKRFQSVFRFG